MFTGIIEGKGRVVDMRRSAAGARLVLEAAGILGADQVHEGDSVAVEGCCLTVATPPEGNRAHFDVIPVTLERTALGDLRPGGAVNLERSLQLGGRIDGHLVQGHVDGVARCEANDRTPDGGWLATFLPEDPSLAENMIPRGSVTIAGVSLTLALLEPPRFGVALIPKTRELTTLGDDLRPGRRVNIETDMMGKYVRRYLEAAGLLKPGTPGLDLDSLRQAGLA